MIERIAELLKHETAGDPISGLKWTHKTPGKIAEQLRRLGITVSSRTVARLLKEMGFSLRVNHKKLESGNRNPPPRDVRDQQFEYISQMREAFAGRGSPIISIDTKKKELIGRFKNNGTTWEREPCLVNDHDFRTDAVGRAVPYGIYDTLANRGFVVVGTSRETPAFAVDAITLWWRSTGSRMYPEAREVLILADCGGGNAARSRVWKYRLQHVLCNRHDVTVTLCHYPPGASKWNPIEHRLFSQISRNWQGRPLDSTETMLKYMRTTSTSTGLKVRASMTRRNYPTGVKITDAQMADLEICWHDEFPKWNYTLLPACQGELSRC